MILLGFLFWAGETPAVRIAGVPPALSYPEHPVIPSKNEVELG